MNEHSGKNTKPEFRKTILIGLGGAGQQIVLRTKRFFLDTYGVVPPSVKILCMDTDDEALRMRSRTGDKTYFIDPDEFLHLQVDNPSEFILNSKDKDPNKNTVDKWYVRPVPVNAINHGAGAVRQNGRLSFFYHINEIRTRLDQLLAKLNHQSLPIEMSMAAETMGATTGFMLSHKPTEIYVCGSIAGGTGSGTFIDCGLLLRQMEPNALIHGFFLLPWVYRNKSFAYRLRQNAYAALAELDNLQSIMFDDAQFHKYQIDYGDLHVEVKKAPYDLFQVIDGRNDYGQNIDSVHDLCEGVANAIFLSVGSMTIPVTSVVDNLLAFVNSQDGIVWKKRYARYSSLGVSSLHYPAPELHRWVAAINALELCGAAIRQIEAGSPVTDTTAASGDTRQQARESVEHFITDQNLHRNNVQAQVCPQRSPVTFQVEAYEIADADFGTSLKKRLATEKKVVEKGVQASFEGKSRVFADEAARSLAQEIKKVTADPRLDSTYRREWGTALFDHVSGLHDAVSQELVAATERLSSLERDAAALFEIAEKSRYIPYIGGHRKSATQDWAEQVGKLLTKVQEVCNLAREKGFYASLLALIESAKATSVPASTDILNALLKVESELQHQATLEGKNLEILRNRPNHVLLGNGNTVIIPSAGEVGASSGQRVRSKPVGEIRRTYEEFIRDEKIHSAEHYLELYNESPDKLVGLFLNYCLKHLDFIPEVSADMALETLAKESGDPDAYRREQFDHLFRLASPLWSFDRGRLNAGQGQLMDMIINIGFCDHEKDLPVYGPIAKDAKVRFHIRSDLAFSTTGDPHHIWMLCFGAALPAYYLNGMAEAKRIYEEQISPTYHIDREFEMNVPDLLPEDENDNMALRLLGMAIVPGIDVIRDDKLTKGHKFTFDNDAVRAINFGEPLTWLLFRDMYADVRTNTSGLLDLLRKQLLEKVQAMDTTELRTCIEQHVSKLEEKLAKRDFSRLASARLTYREIKALKDFLDKKRFAMRMDLYIAGT